jgi:pSer/pThr/pTyr-binding forkhead associated (FHA) protein
VSIKSVAILRYLGRVAFVAKRPGNLFGHLISVGRSATNDITLAVDSVSKVHGYFVREGDGWSFTDHSSTNGTTLEGQMLAPGNTYPLHDGVVLKLGVEAMLQYLSPESLYRKAVKG